MFYFADILRSMKWVEEEKCVITHDIVNRQIQKYTSYCRQQKRFKALLIEEQEAIKCEKARKRKERAKTNDGKKKFVIKERKRIVLESKQGPQKQKLNDNKELNAENGSVTEDEPEHQTCCESQNSQEIIKSPFTVRESLSEVERTEDETDEESDHTNFESCY